MQSHKEGRIDGKVVLITGANCGIGKETALELVRRGGKVYMACRSSERGQEALDDILKATGANDTQVKLLKLDLGSLKSIRNCATDFKNRETKLDILINNAGVAWVPFSKTEDGFESTFGVNHLGHFLLTHLLMDHLVASAPSRIVVLSSVAHTKGRMAFDDVMLEKNYDRAFAYRQSKLANMLFTLELSKRLEGSNVSVYAVHPGIINTEIARHVPLLSNRFVYPVARSLASLFIKDCRQGAQTSIYCATEESIRTDSGKYYSDCKETQPAPLAKDEEAAKKLWTLSKEFVTLGSEDVHEILQDRV